MTIHSFNPLQYAERLEKTGFAQEQAREIANSQMDVIRELMEEKLATKDDLKNFATKEDLLAVKLELKEEISKVRAELIEKLVSKSEIRWSFGIVTGLLTLAIKFLH